MATEEAKIVVNIERGSFKSALKGMEKDVAVSGSRMKTSLSGAFSAGLGNVKGTIKGMFSGIGQHMKTMATLGGAIGAGVLIKNALNLQTAYRNIAYNISKIPGQATKWQDVQGVINKAVEKTGAKAEDLAMAFDKVFRETGSLEVAKGTIEAIGTMATVTGESTERFAEVSRLAYEKFGVGLEKLPDAMSGFESLLGIGGKNVDELSRKFGLMAGAAADAGFTGEEGMKALLNMLLAVDDAVGERPEAALKNMMQALREGGGKGPSDVEKGLGHRFDKGAGLREKMKDVLASGGKARSAFEEKLTEEAKAAFHKMSPAFDEALKKALESGKDKREAVTIALAEFDSVIYGANRETRSFAKNQAEAARRLKDDPALQLQKAMNKLQEVMTSPKALASIKKLMDILPPLAEKMAELLRIIIDNPLLAGGAALVGKGGASFASGYLGNLLFGGGGAKGAGGPGSPGPGSVPNVTGASQWQFGQHIGDIRRGSATGKGGAVTMLPPGQEKMKMSGQQIGAGIASSVAALGVGVSIGTAISGVLQSAADATIKRQNNAIKAYDKIRLEMANLGKIDTPEKAAEASKLLKRLKGTGEYQAERYQGAGGGLNILADTAGAIFGAGDSPFTVIKQNAEIQKAIMNDLSASLKPAAVSVNDFVKAMDKLGKGGTRGPVTKDPPTPGAITVKK